MNLKKYEALTGITISASKRAHYEAQIKRVQSKLETLLGYTLEPQNLYIELVKHRENVFAQIFRKLRPYCHLME